MVSVMAAVPDGDLDRDLDVGAMVSATTMSATMMSVMVSAMANYLILISKKKARSITPGPWCCR